MFSIATVVLSAEAINLKTGKFACASLNYKMEFISFAAAITGKNTGGNVYLKEGLQSVAMGTYSISGSRLVVEFGWATGSAAGLRNQTRMFLIEDTETFYAPGNEEEVWFFLSSY